MGRQQRTNCIVQLSSPAWFNTHHSHHRRTSSNIHRVQKATNQCYASYRMLRVIYAVGYTWTFPPIYGLESSGSTTPSNGSPLIFDSLSLQCSLISRNWIAFAHLAPSSCKQREFGYLKYERSNSCCWTKTWGWNTMFRSSPPRI